LAGAPPSSCTRRGPSRRRPPAAAPPARSAPPSLNGWRRERVASWPVSSFQQERSAHSGPSLVSSGFELDGDRPAYLVADTGRLPQGEVYLSVLGGNGSPGAVGLETSGRWFSSDATGTSYGRASILQYANDRQFRLVTGGLDESSVTSDRVTPASPESGRYRLALTGVDTHPGPLDATFVVYQVRGYLFHVPIEDWVLLAAGLAGYVLLRRCERRHENGARAVFPLALQVVAWVAIWAGVSSLASLAGPESGGNPLAALGIWAGIDLLRLRSGWRTALIVVFWLFILSEVAMLIGTLVYGWPWG
jgi:hypothetical protein